jgi:hypothetical protein
MLQSLLVGMVVMEGEVEEGVTESQASLLLAVLGDRRPEVGVEPEESVVPVVLQLIIQTCDLPK